MLGLEHLNIYSLNDLYVLLKYVSRLSSENDEVSGMASLKNI